jgi:hypothetical protein
MSLTKEMMSWMQQATTMEMTPTKSPSTIEKTRSMRWKTMETIRTPTQRCLWTDLVFFFRHFDPDLPFFFSVAVIFGGVDVFFFVMVLSTNDS